MSYFEEYKCGCVSKDVRSRARLLGYCPTHGEGARNIYQQTRGGMVVIERKAPTRAAKGE